MYSYLRSKDFILRNARPLDIARWYYLFEGGNRDDVLKTLKAYQNIDGGFAHALEPDCWNTRSTPLQTWVATRIIREVHLEDKKHPMILDILNYLASGAEFDGHRWNGLSTVASNNEYPHAPWWSYTQTQESSYNPTASLIGFILKYAEKDSNLYLFACNLAQEAYSYFKDHFPLDSMHEAACYVELYEYIKNTDHTKRHELYHLINLEHFKNLLQQQIKHLITYHTDSWLTDYVCKPSLFIADRSSDFYADNKDICHFECQFIKEHQNKDGTWNVAWNWDAYPNEWAISKNWWQSDIIINNLKYLKAFELA